MIKTAKITHRSKSTNCYKGIDIHCANGVHDEVIKIINGFSELKREEVTIYEFGAGSGALTARLIDNDWRVRPFDICDEDWKCKDIAVSKFDLNSPELPLESDVGTRIVTAVELIEHLNSPFDFYKKLRSLNAGDIVIITTPNLFCSVSLANFLIRENFFAFSKKARYQSGHISPLPMFLMECFAIDNGFEIIKYKKAGSAKINPIVSILIKFTNCILNVIRKSDFGSGHELVTIQVMRKI